LALPIAALLTVGMLTVPISTTFAADYRHRSHSSQHRAAARAPARIACNVLGCQPIPAACTPVPGRTWSGL